MGETLEAVEVKNETGTTSSRNFGLRSTFQKLGTAISFVVGATTFSVFIVELIIGDASADLSLPKLALVMLPLLGASASLAQTPTSRRISIPFLLTAGLVMMVISGVFLIDYSESSPTVAAVAVLLFLGGLGLFAHVAVPAVHDRDVQIVVGLISGWLVFLGSLTLFVFGHKGALIPLGVATVIVVALHLLHEDPTAMRRRFSRSPRPATD